MANLGCLLVSTSVNFLAPILVTAHTVNNLEIGNEQGLQDEGYENSQNFVSRIMIQNFSKV